MDPSVFQMNEPWFRLALTTAQITVWAWNIAAGTITLFSGAPLSPALPPGQLTCTIDELWATIYPPDLSAYQQAVTAALATGDPYQLQLRVRTPEGDLRWIQVSGCVQHGAAGRPVQVVEVNRDISAERQREAAAQAAQQAAAEALARLDAIFISVPTGVAYLDRDLRVVLLNPAFAAINGEAPADLRGRRLAEALPDLAPPLEPLVHRVLASGVAAPDLELHSWLCPRDGLTRDWLIRTYPVAGPADEVVGVGVSITDITPHKRTEAALRETERDLAAIVRTMHEGIVAFHPDGTIARINAAALELGGLSLDIAPATLSNLIQSAKLLLFDARGQGLGPQDWPQHQVLRGESFAGRELCVRLAGSEGPGRWFAVSGTPVYDAHGAITLGVITLQEITQRKRDEAALQSHTEALSRTNAELTRALRLKDEFLAMMSHELRTPLSVILGVCEAMDMELYGPIDDSPRQALASVMQSGRQLLAILTDILDLVYIESGQARLDPQMIDVETLCYSAIQQVRAAAQQKGIRLECSLDQGVDGLCADERWLTQILVSLLDNAIKFTAAGGMAGLKVLADVAQEQIQFVVWDTGIGIAEDDYARLFQPFTQVDGRLSRRYGGVGLGLSLVRRLVELHSGSVRLESAPGQGSRFTVSLHWAEEDNAAPAPAPLPAPWDHPPRVVLADDHEPTLAFYQELLIRQGAQVALARTGAEALAQAREAPPDVMILDIQMPEMDGLEAIRRIRSDPGLAGVPIIALTALAMPGDRERCLAAGASAYLAKPVGLRALVVAITAVIPPASADALGG